jgi:hypothetical protein
LPDLIASAIEKEPDTNRINLNQFFLFKNQTAAAITTIVVPKASGIL